MHGPSRLPARPEGAGTGPRRMGQGWEPGTWARMTLRPSPRTPQAVQCDVSVEEDNHQEWTFTLYGFDNSGKATREVMRPGSHPGDTAGSSRREESQGAFLGQAVGREPLQDTGRADWSLIHSPGSGHCLCRSWWSLASPGHLCPGQQPLSRAVRVRGARHGIPALASSPSAGQ